ncbi:MAG: succinate dehydrogenase, hydrophobic membrane anchor protein [Alphaproteobacteria bacterium]|jgi:succinate dehydrogenase / fumarate reductase membrane anchor subunit
MSIRTPLAHARGLGSAKSGTAHWWAQRLTAIALIPLVIWFVISIIVMTGSSHESVVAWIANPLTAVLMILLIVAVFHHMQLGLQVVIEDYIHTRWMEIALLLFVKGAALLLGALGILSVLKIAIGGA